MKIYRGDNEFELTKEELIDAYYEQQDEFDKSDVLNRINELEDDDEAMRKLLLENVEDIAEDMRRNIDKYDMDWCYALDEAIRKVISQNVTKEE